MNLVGVCSWLSRSVYCRQFCCTCGISEWQTISRVTCSQTALIPNEILYQQAIAKPTVYIATALDPTRTIYPDDQPVPKHITDCIELPAMLLVQSLPESACFLPICIARNCCLQSSERRLGLRVCPCKTTLLKPGSPHMWLCSTHRRHALHCRYRTTLKQAEAEELEQPTQLPVLGELFSCGARARVRWPSTSRPVRLYTVCNQISREAEWAVFHSRG